MNSTPSLPAFQSPLPFDSGEIDDQSGANETLSNESTCSVEYEWFSPEERWTFGLILPVLMATGLCTNIISIYVFCKKSMRKRLINIYLLAIAISDCVLLVSTFLAINLQRIAELLEWWSLAYFSIWSFPVTLTLLNIAYFISVWFTVGACLHRFIGICFPLYANIYLVACNVRRYSIAIIFLAILFNIPRLMQFKLKYCHIEPMGVVLPLLINVRSQFFIQIRTWATVMLTYAIPFALLCILNTLVIVSIQRMFRSRNLRRTLSTEGEQRKSLDQDIRISTMLVAIVLCFLLCNTLILIYNMILNIAPWNLTDALIIWKDILALSNPCLNSIIFYVFLPKYRLAARRLIFCSGTKKVSNSSAAGSRPNMVVTNQTIKNKSSGNTYKTGID